MPGVDSDERDHVPLKRSRLFGTAGYFAAQVMDWKPLQMIVLQRALLPIVRVGERRNGFPIDGDEEVRS
jgi:SPX domain protein involved in polyphosphate accumulation